MCILEQQIYLSFLISLVSGENLGWSSSLKFTHSFLMFFSKPKSISQPVSSLPFKLYEPGKLPTGSSDSQAFSLVADMPREASALGSSGWSKFLGIILDSSLIPKFNSNSFWCTGNFNVGHIWEKQYWNVEADGYREIFIKNPGLWRRGKSRVPYLLFPPSSKLLECDWIRK